MGGVATLSGAVAVLLCTASAAAAAQPQLRISQADADANGITVFLDIRDGDAVVSAPKASALAATLAGKTVPVESVRTFAASDGIFYLLLVDVSKSIRKDAFDLFKAAANGLIGTLTPRDRMAIYSVGDAVKLAQAATDNKQSLADVLETLKADNDYTRLYAALDLAIQYARSRNDWPKRRAILVMTDGKDDGSGLMVEDLRRREDEGRVPIFATGYRPERLTAADRTALASLQNIAVMSGGLFEEATPTQTGRVHEHVQAAARQVAIVRFTCRDCGTEPLTRPLSVTYTAGGLTVSDTAPVTLVPCTSCGGVPPWAIWTAIGGGVALVAIAITGVIISTRRRRAAPVEVPQPAFVAPPPPPRPPSVPQRPIDPTRVEPVAPRTAPAAGQALAFIVVHGGKPGQRFAGTVTAAKPLVAGRASACDIVIQQDPAIVDRQFEIRIEPSGIVVVLDLAGGGKTRKNGVPIAVRAKLEDGDIIGAGSTELRVRFGAS
jgi:von Willebrand factor type A domain/FHA domain